MNRSSEDITGRVTVVTGANSGIGRAIARNLAGMNASVVLACRDRDRGRTTRRELNEATGNPNLQFLRVDVADAASVRRFRRRFQERFDRLDVLVNNAAVLPRTKQINEHGVERTWATNVLGYLLMSNVLEETLIASAPARIVNVASTFAGGLVLDDLQFRARSFRGWKAYRQSKQANRMLSWVRAERLRDRGVTVNVAHPGGVPTNLFRHQVFLLRWGAWLAARLLGNTPVQGADTPTWLAVSPELEGVTRKFWADRTERDRVFDDPDANRALWQRCQAMLPEAMRVS